MSASAGSGSISAVTIKCFSRFAGLTAVHLLRSSLAGLRRKVLGGGDNSAIFSATVTLWLGGDKHPEGILACPLSLIHGGIGRAAQVIEVLLVCVHQGGAYADAIVALNMA